VLGREQLPLQLREVLMKCAEDLFQCAHPNSRRQTSSLWPFTQIDSELTIDLSSLRLNATQKFGVHAIHFFLRLLLSVDFGFLKSLQVTHHSTGSCRGGILRALTFTPQSLCCSSTTAGPALSGLG